MKFGLCLVRSLIIRVQLSRVWRADMSKYDRQIRLWSETGQGSLSEAWVLVLGVSASTTELVKNIVLAGVAAVTIVDEHNVTSADCAANFFMLQSDEGRNRAKVVAETVAELNPETRVDGINETVYHWISTPERAQNYTLIVTSRFSTEMLQKIQESLPTTPILQVESYGFYGRLRCLFKMHTIVESHPETRVELHLHSIWPALREFSDSINLNAISGYEHEHVPYIVLLIKGLDIWRTKKGDKLPSTMSEKAEFKKILREFSRSFHQENTEEAIRNSWRISAPSVPEGVKDIVEMQGHDTLFSDLAQALKVFIDKNARVPLSGVLPDMKSDTNWYTQVTNIYREKSQSDLEEFTGYYLDVCSQNGTEPAPSSKVKLFCNNSRHIRVQVGIPVAQDTSDIRSSGFEAKDIFSYMEAADSYRETKQNDLWNDEAKGVEWLTDINGDTDTLRAFWNSGGGEIHSIASFMGGLAAQEAVKLIMHQYTPLMHTLIYNGIQQATYIHHNGQTFN